MSDHDRGPYIPPTDAPLSFDARQPVRGHRPMPFTLIISALVLIGLVGAIFMFYRAGVRQAGQAPQTVGTPIGELKGPAPAEAQPTDPAAGLQIYRSEAGQPAESVAAPQFVNPPEQPQPRPQPAPPVVMLPPAPAPTTPVAAAPLRPAAPASVQTPPAKADPTPTPAPAKTTPAPATGGAVAQIGAVSSTALADKAWNDAVALAPGLAAGKGKSVQKIDKDGKTLYRTAVTGFASRADAQAFCARVTAAGKGCFVR